MTRPHGVRSTPPRRHLAIVRDGVQEWTPDPARTVTWRSLAVVILAILAALLAAGCR